MFTPIAKSSIGCSLVVSIGLTKRIGLGFDLSTTNVSFSTMFKVQKTLKSCVMVSIKVTSTPTHAIFGTH
jgi:hypothetical protein